MSNLEIEVSLIKEKTESNSKEIEILKNKQEKNEEVLNSLDKSLSITIEQIKNIAEDLKTTSVNFKEAIMRSNTANSKETEILKEKYAELEKKYEKLDTKLEQETIIKDAESWRTSKKQVIAWVIATVLGIVAIFFGLK